MGDFFVTVNGPRAADFEKVFGTARVPVMTPVPIRATLPGRGASLVYLLDLKAIDAEQRGRLVAHLARTFGLSLDEVARDLDRDGMPILAESCTVTILNSQKWLS